MSSNFKTVLETRTEVCSSCCRKSGLTVHLPASRACGGRRKDEISLLSHLLLLKWFHHHQVGVCERFCCCILECCCYVALLRDDARHIGDTKIDMDGAENQMQMLEQQV